MSFQNVEHHAHQVWTSTTVEAKREAFIAMLNASSITAAKKQKYLADLLKWSATKIDMNASNFMLFDKDPVIK